MRARIWLSSLLCSGLFATSAFAINPFTLIEDGYPEGKGVAELENTLDFDYHLGSDHGFKQFTVEHEIEYGWSDDLVLRVAGSYYYEKSQDNEGFHFDTFKLEGQYYFSNPNTDDIGVSVLGAAEIGEHSLTFTGIGIVQKDWDKWTVAANFGATVEIDGVFENSSSTTTTTTTGGTAGTTPVTTTTTTTTTSNNSTSGSLFGGIGACYAVSNTVRVGANASVELGYDNLNDYTGTTVYAGPTFCWVPDEHWWITAGPSFQLTNENDAPDWNFHIVVAYYF